MARTAAAPSMSWASRLSTGMPSRDTMRAREAPVAPRTALGTDDGFTRGPEVSRRPGVSEGHYERPEPKFPLGDPPVPWIGPRGAVCIEWPRSADPVAGDPPGILAQSRGDDTCRGSR